LSCIDPTATGTARRGYAVVAECLSRQQHHFPCTVKPNRCSKGVVVVAPVYVATVFLVPALVKQVMPQRDSKSVTGNWFGLAATGRGMIARVRPQPAYACITPRAKMLSNEIATKAYVQLNGHCHWMTAVPKRHGPRHCCCGG
jgi:hypothetical protein